ncbi:PASTA domain-containing protein [Luedemannella flava]
MCLLCGWLGFITWFQDDKDTSAVVTPTATVTVAPGATATGGTGATASAGTTDGATAGAGATTTGGVAATASAGASGGPAATPSAGGATSTPTDTAAPGDSTAEPKPTVTVPSVIGKTVAEAEKILADAGLTDVTFDGPGVPVQPDWKVTKQSIKAGTKVPADEPIVITVVELTGRG